MFEYINGRIDYICPAYITIEANSVGYLIIVANPFLFQNKVNTICKVYLHHYVREDFVALYGFVSRKERELFLKLINVKGIGPKGALAILASGHVAKVAAAVETEDENYLIKFPGVGKKTARQIILDLKGNLQSFLETETSNFEQQPATAEKNEALEEALLALQSLGYSERELEKIGKHIGKDKHTAEEYIKLALQFTLK